MKIQRTLLLVVPLFLTACVTDGGAPQKTSLEIQSFQSKQFEADKKTAFNSTMSVFRGCGFGRPIGP